VLFGATFGVGLGIAGLLTYNLGLFATDLRGEIGLGPAAYGASLLALNLALAAAVPVAGRVVDSVGPRAAAAAGAAFLALGFLALSRVTSVPSYAAVLVAIGLFASLSAPIAHTRAVAGKFESQRGLALGITQIGIGLAAALVPPLVATQIASGGWRSGFLLLAALAGLGVVPALLGLPRKVRSSKPPDGNLAVESRLGSSANFWLQLSAFTAMALAFIGLIAHFVPMLRAGGMPLEKAGALAGAIGLSVIVTRLVVGWLADRIEPAWLGAASCVICGVGALASPKAARRSPCRQLLHSAARSERRPI
jgi:predicted MFS family arabinose efflux permease